MRLWVKVILLCGAFVLLGMHFTLLLIQTLWHPPQKTRLNYWADHYAYPFFQQGWSLFAPAPNVNYKLFVAYERNGPQQQELISNCLWKHQDNLLAGREAPLLALCNSAHFFEKSSPLKNPLNGPVQNDVYFDILEQQALRYLNSRTETKVKACKLALYVHDFVTEQEYVYYNSAFLN